MINKEITYLLTYLHALFVRTSDRDGFSLKTLYRDRRWPNGRDMIFFSSVAELAPVDLLQIFGAMLPCELRLSETFYGSGELFLFTFFPAFKVQSLYP